MYKKSKLGKIKALLGMEIALMAEANLKDGTLIGTDAEEWTVGVLAYVVTEEGDKMPLPTGEFELEDGRVMVIEDGTVTEIRDAVVIEEEVIEEEAIEASVSKKQLIAVLEELSKDFDSKLENLAKELSGSLKNFSASKPVHKKSINRVQKVEFAKPMTEMNAAERAMAIFSKSSNN
tara:strand:- start:2117 stop:2647 length:531 start_codon:yes stop_codon:yes gene_type:complete